MFEFIKFAFVGVLNTLVDFIVLNVLLVFFGVGTRGQLFPFFKAISFLVAVANSYLLNKYWVFKHDGVAHMYEQILFVLVSVFGFVVNVGISHVVFTTLMSWGGFSMILAANIGALVGTGVVFVSNFFGYKFIVFTKKAYE